MMKSLSVASLDGGKAAKDGDFMLSGDQSCIAKVVKKAEGRAFSNAMDAYLTYVKRRLVDREDLLLAKIVGFFTIKDNTDMRYVVVQENVFQPPIDILHRYDLKGQHGRGALPSSSTGCEVEFNDLGNGNLLVTKKSVRRFQEALLADVAFLREIAVLDYSLICGVTRNRTLVVGIIDYLRKESLGLKLYAASPFSSGAMMVGGSKAYADRFQSYMEHDFVHPVAEALVRHSSSAPYDPSMYDAILEGESEAVGDLLKVTSRHF